MSSSHHLLPHIIPLPSTIQIKSKCGLHDDYSEGAHPSVIEALARTNLSQQSGYGDDEFCENARQAVRQLMGADEASIYFTPGGTGANILAIASHLRPHEAVISAASGHIVGKEGGAIEAIGHQILVEPSADGKLTPEKIQSTFHRSSLFAYRPKAKMVFISNATEVGTIYTKAELAAIASVCQDLKLLLLMDGARLGAALASPKSDMSMRDVYNLTDVFWIGGTKNGALLGEAVVIKDPSFGTQFPYYMKQRRALLAKGRVLGIQFSTLLRDDLLFRLARHSNVAAADMSSCLVKLGFKLWQETESNQVFVVLPPELVQELQESFDFFIWDTLGDGSLVVWPVTSWATDVVEAERFCKVVGQWKNRC